MNKNRNPLTADKCMIAGKVDHAAAVSINVEHFPNLIESGPVALDPANWHNRIATVDELMRDAFSGPRNPRSHEYKQGVRAALQFRFEGKKITCSYPPGKAESGAFHA